MAFSNPRNIFYIRLFAIIQISLGLALALLLSKYGNLDCDRSTNLCQFENGNLLGAKRETFPISKFQGAKIETNTRKDKYGRIFTSDRIMLVPSRIFLIENYSPGETPKQIANQINNFVKDPQQQRLQVSQDERFFGTPIGIGLIMLGMLLLNRINQSS